MKEENRQYGQLAFDIVEHAAKKIGSRLPGSEGEKKLHDYMCEKLEEIGIKPTVEEFAVSTRSGIGGLGYAGYFGIIMSALMYFALHNEYLWFGMAIAGIIFVIWLFSSCFLYKQWFDMFFPQKISRNSYGELLPEDGKYDYTIVLSGHSDTSWTWRHSEHSYKYRDKPILGLLATYIKVGFGAVCVFLNVGISIAMAVIYGAYYIVEHFGSESHYITTEWGERMYAWFNNVTNSPSFNAFQFILLFLPIVTAIGSAFVAMWGDPHEENASRGAMDNATGIALSYAVIKYFKDNPDKMPKNCRIIDMNCGSEESGLRGSIAFTQEHKNDGMLDNCWNLNIDSVADKDYFEVVIKDDWQGCRFDKDLEKMFKDTFNELGIESKTNGCIHNPVGGCDSTPMTRAGVKSVTFAAQNPMLTYYYHTWRDMPERFEMETVSQGFDVLLGVIDKIDKFQTEHGFNGVNH
ncbi:MAG: M28 family peptidase [Oscillospiraceae bacterium]|nr:M28 family peptidase [Oscillospiraceae bacterium]